MTKHNCLKRIAAFILLVAIASVPFFAMASGPIWGDIHNFCNGPTAEWLIYHPNEDWHKDYRHDYYDYEQLDEIEHTCMDELSGVCIFCNTRVTCMMGRIPQKHNHNINGGSALVSITNLNASQHRRKYKDTKKCICGHPAYSYRTVNENHTFRMQSQTKSNGYIISTYKCTGCGRTNVVRARTR